MAEKILKVPEKMTYDLNDDDKKNLSILLEKAKVFKKSALYGMIFQLGMTEMLKKYGE